MGESEYLDGIPSRARESYGSVADDGVAHNEAELASIGSIGLACPSSCGCCQLQAKGEVDCEVVNVPTRISCAEQPGGMSSGRMGTGSPISTSLSGISGHV